MSVRLIIQLLPLVGGWVSVNRLNPISLMAVVIPTDSPNSVRIRYVIELLVEYLCCQLFFLIFCCYMGFVIGLSQISFFYSLLHDLLG